MAVDVSEDGIHVRVGVDAAGVFSGLSAAERELVGLERTLAGTGDWHSAGGGAQRFMVAVRQRAIPAFMQAVRRGVYLGAEEIGAEAVARAPVHEGVMRNSKAVSRPEGERIVTSVVSFGDQARDYVRVQHEDLTLHHPKGGEAKFLEKSLRPDRFRATVERAVKAAIGKLRTVT